jgi:hypothetical protein
MRNDQLRERREREFQRRVLSALEKKQNRIWAFLNSGIVLWFLTAMIITVGGSFITNHKQCLADARQIISRYQH